MQSAPTPDARALDALYGEGYYHGVNSGFPAAGYESEHATWIHWVDHLARDLGRGARWLDLGCAYGYLVAEARAGGLAALGVDVSGYGLGRAASEAPAARGRLARGLIERLPFGDATFDVVSAFDVLEHLVDPEAALAEACRVLRPGGVMIGATPDPRLFARREATHVSERPPSYWIDRLLALGFAVDFRFFQAPYNLEVLAERGTRGVLRPAARLRPEGFGSEPDLGTASGPAAGRVAVRLRAGFGTVRADQPRGARWLEAGEGLAYVLVAGLEPARLGVRLEARAASGTAELAVALDERRLAAATLGEDWAALETGAVPAAAGGHHLRLSASAPLFVRRLDVAAAPAARAELLADLPFDVYRRYDQCRAVAARLDGPARRVLDVGGALGGAGGHRAAPADFFPAAETVSVDARATDHPGHRQAPPGVLPFPDASFDLVLCLDVLESLPLAARPAVIDELARVSRRFVLLGAAFATSGVAAADALLAALLRRRRGDVPVRLADRLAHGHPDLEATVAALAKRGASVVVLPNGYLPYWTLMQAASLRLSEPAMGERYARGQALYNGQVADWREPAYRHLVIADLGGGTGWCDAVRALAAEPGGDEEARAAAVLDRVLDLACAPAPPAAAGAAERGVSSSGRPPVAPTAGPPTAAPPTAGPPAAGAPTAGARGAADGPGRGGDLAYDAAQPSRPAGAAGAGARGPRRAVARARALWRRLSGGARR